MAFQTIESIATELDAALRKEGLFADIEGNASGLFITPRSPADRQRIEKFLANRSFAWPILVLNPQKPPKGFAIQPKIGTQR
jgi:hypothetical protein